MKTIPFIAALLLSALPLTASAQKGQGQWKIDYIYNGSWTEVNDGITSVYDIVDHWSQREGFGSAGDWHRFSSLSGTLAAHCRIVVSWTGDAQHPAPQPRFLRLHSLLDIYWASSQGSNKADNGLDDLQKDLGSDNGDPTHHHWSSDGLGSFPIHLDGNNSMTVDIPVYGTAEVAGQTGYVDVTSLFEGSVLPCVVWPDSLPGPTYHRLPGGKAEAGGWSEKTGKCIVDQGYKILDFNGWLADGEKFPFKGEYREHLTGQTVGDWFYAVHSFDWTPAMYWVNKDWDRGWSDAFTWPTYVSGAYLASLFNGPDQRSPSITISDGTHTETGAFTIRYHGPVEKTDESWKKDLPMTQLSKVPEARQCSFTDEPIGGVTNDSDQTMQAVVTITRDVTYSYGMQQTYGGSIGAEWEIVKASLTAEHKVETSTTYKVGQSYAINVPLPPHCSLVLTSVPMGTVTYPICSKWGGGGWSGDGSYLGVGWGYLNFVAKVFHGGGGRLP